LQILIVYYSRTGTTKKLAEKLVQEFKADSLEIVDRRRRKGFFALIKASFDALTANVTLIEQFPHQLEDYDLIILGGPVWAFSITPALRTFLLGNSEILPEVAFFLTHAGSGAERPLKQMGSLTGRDPLATLVLERSIIQEEKPELDEEIKHFKDLIDSKL